jgi:hypothetical protein
MGFLGRFFGWEAKREDSTENKPSLLDISKLATLLDERLEKSQSQALKKTSAAVKKIIQEKAVAQNLVEQIKEIDFDDDIKDRTYKPILTSKPVYVRGMLEGLKGIKDATPQDFEELSAFSDRVTKSLKTIQNVQHKKGRYMSFAFQKEMLSLGTRLNRMIDATTRLEGELSKVARVSDENGEISADMALLEAKIRSVEEGSEKAASQGRKVRRLEEKIASLEEEIKELKDSEEYKKHIELGTEHERAESGLGELDSRVNGLVSPLKRLFRKFEKFLEDGSAGADKKFLERLREYQDSPKQAFSGEDQSNIILQTILSGLKEAITGGGIPLSESEKKKTLNRIGRLEGGVIAELLTQRVALFEQALSAQEALSHSDVKVKMEERSVRLESLKKERDEAGDANHQNPTAVIEIDDLKDTIELKATKLLGRTVELVIPELETADIREDL